MNFARLGTETWDRFEQIYIAKKYINSLEGWEWVPTMLVG